eukprot:m.15010 g.15010  ORF g.15010 m.15010 type:complete len:62 (-) comp6575_c0_seq1:54-239(-)
MTNPASWAAVRISSARCTASGLINARVLSIVLCVRFVAKVQIKFNLSQHGFFSQVFLSLGA